MPRGRPMPRRGGARGGRGGAVTGGGRGNAPSTHVAKPAVKDLPDDLVIAPTHESLPDSVVAAFPEFSKAQPFFTAIEKLCPEYTSSTHNFKHCWMGVSGALISRIEREDTGYLASIVYNDETRQPIFVKRIHLLDPMSAMEGEYVWPSDGALSAPSEPWRTALTKINDPLNEAYVDAVFAAVASRLVESGRSPHWCRSFGTFSARVEKYLYDISEEYGSIKNKPWWRRNQRQGLFSVYDPRKDDDAGSDSGLLTSEAVELDVGDFEELPPAEDVAVASEGRDDTAEMELAEGEAVHLAEPRLRLERMTATGSTSSSSDKSGEDGDADADESSEEDVYMYAEFADFPVQVTLLERAEGTLDELLDAEEDDAKLAETKEARWAAWLFQIIAALNAAQHYFGFVHNDLHTNNVMWSRTTATHLYYRVHNNKSKDSCVYKVPTYGYIMKIIDFGRASFFLPEPAGFFISDAFYPGNDAGEQYNCEPFYDAEEGKKVEPNPSFDLCRLAVSLLESLYPERPLCVSPPRVMTKEAGKMYMETVSGVYNMIWEWLQDDSGRNVLRKPDGEERYPDFDLYKAIAAEVHRAVPARQIERGLFASYKCGSAPDGQAVYDLWI